MSSNSQNNQVVFQNHVANGHVVVGNEMVRGFAILRPQIIGKRPSDPRAKKRAAWAEPAKAAALGGGYSMGHMPGLTTACRVDSTRTTLSPTAGDPPAAIWASLVISRALSS